MKIRTIFLHCTKGCNLMCKYCYFSARHPMPGEMTTLQFENLWPQIVCLEPEKVVFTGGEPLMRPDMLTLLESFKAASKGSGILCCLNTNGHLVTQTLAKRFVGLVDEVRVSLDGLAERNDELRGTGNFRAAITALEILYSVGFEPKVLVTLTSVSLPDLEELLCLLYSKHITRVTLNSLRPVGRATSHWHWRADSAQITGAINRARRRCELPAVPLVASPPEEDQCHCGVGGFLNILPNGDVFPCHVLTQPEFRCGNCLDTPLTQICRENGFLGQLAQLDFRHLAKDDSRVAGLTRPSTCMGTVYAKTRSLSVWRKHIPALPEVEEKVSQAERLPERSEHQSDG